MAAETKETEEVQTRAAARRPLRPSPPEARPPRGARPRYDFNPDGEDEEPPPRRWTGFNLVKSLPKWVATSHVAKRGVRESPSRTFGRISAVSAQNCIRNRLSSTVRRPERPYKRQKSRNPGLSWTQVAVQQKLPAHELPAPAQWLAGV